MEKTTAVRLNIGLFFFLMVGYSAVGQDTLSGYASYLRGETIGYTSYTPMAGQALLTRTNSGDMAIEWKTDPVPAHFEKDTAYFAWVGGNASGTLSEEAPFDLFINDTFILTIRVGKDYQSPGWYFSSDKGVSIRFQKKWIDQSNDLSGDVTLAVPRSLFSPGKPLTIKIVGQKKDNRDWFMVYQYNMNNQFLVEALPLLKRTPGGDTTRILRIYGQYKEGEGVLLAQMPGLGPLRFVVHKGYNECQWAIPYHSMDTSVMVALSIDHQSFVADTIRLTSLMPLELHLIAHSHTDIGYSNLQQNVAAIQIANIRKAMVLIDRTKDYPFDAQFRWNIESLWAVENFLDSAGPAETQAFAESLATGRLVLQAFYANELTGLMDAEELTWLTAYARVLEQRFHIKIHSAMITDVPGYTWSTIRAMQEAGIHYFSIGPNNSDRIGGVVSTWADKPFYWRAPGSDQPVLTDVAGSGYAWFHGSAGARDPGRLTQRLTAYVNRLNDEKYPYRYALLRYNIISDNAPLDTGISNFVRTWNEEYCYPALVLSSPEIVLSRIEKEYGPRLPVYSGDMSPYWEDGAASTAAELGMNRRIRDSLEQSEALEAILQARHSHDSTQFPADSDWYKAWRGVVLFDEHTWGAYNSITDPDNDFVRQQWAFKRKFLSDAAASSRDIRRQLAPPCKHPYPLYEVVNTHSWPTNGLVRIHGLANNERIVANVRGGSYLPQQYLSDGDRLVYVSPIPSLGAKMIGAVSTYSEGTPLPPVSVPGAVRQGFVLENHWLSIHVDSVTGALSSIVLKDRNQDIVQKTTFGFNQYEYVPGRDPSDAKTAHLIHMSVTENGPLCTVIRVQCDAPGTTGLFIDYILDNKTGTLTIRDSVHKTFKREKEAVHFAFPFSIPGADLMADNGGMAYHPFTDTLAGGNRDFGYVGKWLDLSGPTWGITFCPEETPLMEWGAMRSEVIPPSSSVSSWKKSFTPTQTLFSYAMNNYWHTNYKADQEGWATFTYTVIPHGPRNLSDCYKWGEENSEALILLQTDKKPPTSPIIRLTNPLAVISAWLPTYEGHIWTVYVYNPSDKSMSTEVYKGNEKIGQTIMLGPYEERHVLLSDHTALP